MESYPDEEQVDNYDNNFKDADSENIDVSVLDTSVSNKSIFVVYDDDITEDSKEEAIIDDILDAPDFSLPDFLTQLSLIDASKYTILEEGKDDEAVIEEFEKIVIDLENKKNGSIKKYIRGNYTIHFFPTRTFYEYEKNMNDGYLDYNDRDTLAKENTGIIYMVAKKYFPHHEKLVVGYTKEDVISTCGIGFSKAINSFNKNLGVKFTTYAVYVMENECKNLVNREKQVLLRPQESILSTSYTKNPKDGKKGVDWEIEDVNYIGVEGEIEKIELKTMIEELLSCLPNEDSELIKFYFGIGKEKMTQIEISKMLHISQPLVNLRIKQILEKLKKKMERLGLDLSL